MCYATNIKRLRDCWFACFTIWEIVRCMVKSSKKILSVRKWIKEKGVIRVSLVFKKKSSSLLFFVLLFLFWILVVDLFVFLIVHENRASTKNNRNSLFVLSSFSSCRNDPNSIDNFFNVEINSLHKGQEIDADENFSKMWI